MEIIFLCRCIKEIGITDVCKKRIFRCKMVFFSESTHLFGFERRDIKNILKYPVFAAEVAFEGVLSTHSMTEALIKTIRTFAVRYEICCRVLKK